MQPRRVRLIGGQRVQRGRAQRDAIIAAGIAPNSQFELERGEITARRADCIRCIRNFVFARTSLRTVHKGVVRLRRQPVLPDISELRIIHADVFVAERGEHELSLERAVQQIGQIPQTLQAQLHAHAGNARQRVTATSSYSLVSPSYTERPALRQAGRRRGSEEGGGQGSGVRG